VATVVECDAEESVTWVCACMSRLVGWDYDGSPPARLRLVSELPMIGFVPE
jgi:hypothetical protein